MAADFLTAGVFGFFLVFVRMGAAIMLLPAIGDNAVSPRIRLMFALAFSLVVTPVVQAGIPAMPEAPAALARLVVSEVVIGLFFGTVTRLMLSALQLTGMIFGFQSGLSAATLFDPNQSMQSPVVATFLNLIVITMIFSTDLHHLLLRGLIDTYALFPIGSFLPVDGGAEAVMRIASDSFRIGLQLSAPVLIAGFLLSLGAGLVNRLMPQMMVFFVLIPVQITGTFAVLMVTLSATVYWYLSYFDQTMASLAAARSG